MFKKKTNRIVVCGDIALVYLSDTLVTLVDVTDLPMVKRHYWRANKWKTGNKYYAATRVKGYYGWIFLYQGVNKTPAGFKTDHINGFSLDNRRKNLRSCTQQQNCWNRKEVKGSTGYRGVTKRGDVYEVRIKGADRKQVFKGGFYRAVDAAKVYDKLAKELRGEFAVLNFPEKVKKVA